MAKVFPTKNTRKRLTSMTKFTLNNQPVGATSPRGLRLSQILREEFGLTGTKVGCDAGDCGACTVLLNGEPVCACLTALGQVEAMRVDTIEGLGRNSDVTRRLQQSFLAHGAAQCGICTPGMLVAATHLLARQPNPTEQEAMDAVGGVLCRCTGYRKIIAAICSASAEPAMEQQPPPGKAVGARLQRVDGRRKVEGTDVFGADAYPEDALLLRAVRCPFNRARFSFGDLDAFVAAHPGIHRVLTAKDVVGVNCYGVIPAFADQMVFAETEARYRGEAVAALVGEPAAVEGLELAQFPVRWEELPSLLSIDAALEGNAPPIHADAAATVIANAVDLPDHPEIQRVPACELQPDTDLGSRLVTRSVPRLGDDEIEQALSAGVTCAEQARARGLVTAAALHLQGCTHFAGAMTSLPIPGRFESERKRGAWLSW